MTRATEKTLTWGVLGVLLAALLVGAATLDRSSWPSLVGDEATYRMQAESLAFDLDLRYTKEDYERFVAHHGEMPEGLILQRPLTGQDDISTYGKPFFYAAYLAPFVRLSPQRGPFVANALLLALTALAAARVLRRRLGLRAPLWVAFAVFGSVSFIYAFWVHADLFMMCLAGLALSLAADVLWRPPEESLAGRWLAARWLLTGVLVAVVAFSRPMYATLILPVAAVACRRLPPSNPPKGPWRDGRATRLAALAAGVLAVVLGAGAVHQGLTGSWTSYGAQRAGFYSYTGFPEVGGSWEESGNRAWLTLTEVGTKKVSPSLWAWNTVYYLAGRHVGLLPYFLPVLLGLAGLSLAREERAWSLALLAAALLMAGAFLHLRPFNFWGGGGAVGNRYFLPLYPLFWFLPTRRLHGAWLAAGTLAAALFLAPLWAAPRAFPLFDGTSYRYVSAVSRHWLPYETTQSHLKPSGQEDVHHGGLWIKFLDRGLVASRDAERLRLRPGGGTLLIGSPTPLEALDVELRAPDDTVLHVDGGTLSTVGRRESWQLLRLTLDGRRARHPMWWTWDPIYLYQLRLTSDNVDRPLALRFRPAVR